MEYVLTKAARRPSLRGLWNELPWRSVPAIRLTHFLARSKSRHPRVTVKAVYRHDGLFVFFRVFDKYVRSVRTRYHGHVCRDSCVEFFVEPRPGRGYFNFEINAGGILHLSFYEQRPISPGAPVAYRCRPVPWSLARRVEIYHSLPRVVHPEIKVDTPWLIEYFIPFTLFERYLGSLGPLRGQVWRGNFYKCADYTSHPHWVSWAPLGPKFSFHVPQYFAPVRFA